MKLRKTILILARKDIFGNFPGKWFAQDDRRQYYPLFESDSS